MRKNRIIAIGLLAAAVIGGTACSAGSNSAAAQESTQVESAAQAEETEANTEATVIETVDGTIESLEETKAQTLQPVKLYGAVSQIEEGRLTIDSQAALSEESQSEGTYIGEVVLNISEDTLILDGVNGYPVKEEDLEEGSMIYAYVGPAMTMSLPPMTTAELILCQIPEDAKAPEYVEIKSVVSEAESGNAVLTAADGSTYEIGEDCQILPYLTRNIVTLSDLTEGRKCLIWADEENAAAKIVLFAAE